MGRVLTRKAKLEFDEEKRICMAEKLKTDFGLKVAPLEMPEQNLESSRSQRFYRLPALPIAVVLWRALMLLLTSALSVYFATELYGVLALNGITFFQIAFLIFSTISFIGISIGASASLCGFIGLVGRLPSTQLDLDDVPDGLHTRTALLFPIYHEDPDEIADTISTLAGEIHKDGVSNNFSFFILSDSKNADSREREAMVFAALQEQLSTSCPVYFRWRANNEGKKAGNIKDWVMKHGRMFEHFVVFDADSTMTLSTITRLARAMEMYQKVALIQTVPKLVGGTTLMSQLQQFAAWVYGPVLAVGNAYWMGRDSNYWGHNAIIRTEAFSASAGLPGLPGTPPFGGNIQSHDFVEAALLRKAGWEVHLVPELGGSYEGCPPSIEDCLVRDRRWCQGNLQHIRMLKANGFTGVSRFHFLSGIMCYLSSIAWLCGLTAGLITAYQWLHKEHQYFTDQISLFPNWPVMDSDRAFSLVIFTVAVLLLPKGLGLIYALVFDHRWSGVLAKCRLIGGFVIEIFLSAIIAPIFMISHAGAILSILLGRDSGWHTQNRDGETRDFIEQCSRFAPHFFIGVALLIFCSLISEELTYWLALIYTGLIVAPIITWMSGLQSDKILSFFLKTPHEELSSMREERLPSDTNPVLADAESCGEFQRFVG